MNKNYVIKDPIEIGKFIKTNREFFQITTNRLAQILDVSLTAVLDWEKGKKMPTLQKCCCLAQLFSISIDQFYACESPRRINSSINTFLNYLQWEGSMDSSELMEKILHEKFSNVSMKNIVADADNVLKKFNLLFEKIMQGENVDEETFNYYSLLVGFHLYWKYGVDNLYVYLIEKYDILFDLDVLLKNEFIEEFHFWTTKYPSEISFNSISTSVDCLKNIERMFSEGRIKIGKSIRTSAIDEIEFDKIIYNELYDMVKIKDSENHIATIKRFRLGSNKRDIIKYEEVNSLFKKLNYYINYSDNEVLFKLDNINKPFDINNYKKFFYLDEVSHFSGFEGLELEKYFKFQKHFNYEESMSFPAMKEDFRYNYVIDKDEKNLAAPAYVVTYTELDVE